MDFLKEIQVLKSQNNFDREAWLAMFNEKTRADIVRDFGPLLESNKKKILKTYRSKCIKCKIQYESDRDDLGKCFVCNSQVIQELLALPEPELAKPARKVFPHRLGKIRILQIQRFFCKNPALFPKKVKAQIIINREFGTDLTEEEALSLINVNNLHKSGVFEIYERNYLLKALD